MAEYFFEKKIKLVNDELGFDIKGTPDIFVERDYSDQSLLYVMYMTLPCAYAKTAVGQVFSNIKLRFDKSGIYSDLVSGEEFTDLRKESIEVNELDGKVNTWDKFKKAGYRLVIAKSDKELSGCGRVIFEKDGKETEYLFATNFRFKKKIYYRIKKGNLYFECNDLIKEDIPIKILCNPSRYPCLKSDAREASIDRKIFEFKSKGIKKGYKIIEKTDEKLCVVFDHDKCRAAGLEDIENHYMLVCLGNDTLDISDKAFKHPNPQTFCPYCHAPMNKKAIHGVSSCVGREKDKQIQFVDMRKKTLKEVIYCKDDNICASKDFNRILPENYLQNKVYKLAVIGPKRSGKTTFLSRLFDIESDDSTGLTVNASYVKNALNSTSGGARSKNKKICDLVPYLNKIKSIFKEEGMDGNVFSVSDNAWSSSTLTARNFYSKYEIDVVKGKFPAPTDSQIVNKSATNNTFKYPFIFEVDKSNYIDIYDIAGEDVERNPDRLKALLDDCTCGVFYLVDGDVLLGEKGPEGANSAIEQFTKAAKAILKQGCPIAVIVSKFDKLEKHFDVNCHCVRSDEFEMIKNDYEGSPLEISVNIASAEIDAYLTENNINPFDESDKEKANIKYFSVSAFANCNAVFHKIGSDDTGRGTDEVNYLKFETSPKRLELPLIWMLKQFGCLI